MFFKTKTIKLFNKTFSFRNKAVSDGAISFYLDHFVRSRVSKFTYGYFASILYDPSDPDHRSRSHKVFTFPSGEHLIPMFDIILPKVSCFFPFKGVLLKKNLEYPNFGDEGIKKVLFRKQGFKVHGWFPKL